MERIKIATEMFDEGFNCAQAILAAFGPGLGVDRQTALKLGSPLGGGLSRTGGTCGAALGSLLILGLRHGHVDIDDDEQSDLCRAETQEFLRRLGVKRGGTTCPEILNADLSQPGELERAKDEDLFEKSCPHAVREAAEILVELL
ncbi:MAG: C-GCAxxG-C-C family protein [Gemmatimonadales bacterium]|nr:C-GCAxxG-C-C family protein [Gemmatimonadales bacterium]